MSSGDSITAVQTSLEILETLGAMGGAGVSQLATEMNRSKSTVHRHLKSLESEGYVVRDGSDYHVGLRSLRLAANALDRYEVFPLCKSVVNELVEETGESAAIAVEEDGAAVYLYYNRTNRAVKTDARLGIRLQLHCTGTGKAILAHLPEDRIEEVIAAGLPSMTANTITDPDALRAELEEIRETGIAYDDEERLEGMRGIATPILNREDGTLYGALTIAGPTRRLTEDKFRDEYPYLLRQAADMVEVTLTYE